MKKSFLALLVASLMLVGCATNVTPAGSEGSQGGSESQGSESQGSESSQGGGDVVIPTEDGKVTFYFELASSSVALPSWAGFFLTGAFSGWETAVADVVELTKLEGSDNVYYGMWATADAITDGSYQLTVGYKADAGAPSSGVDWTFKSVECAAYEFGSNPEFEVVDGKANLGTHTWEAMPSNPADAAISNLTLSVPFTAAVPEYVDIYLVGGAPFSWAMDDACKMTPSADRKTWTMTIATIIGNTYEIKVMANYTGEHGWDHTILDNGSGGNYSLGVLKTWGNNYTCNLAEDNWQENNVFDIDWATFMPELGEKHNVTLKVVFDAAITQDAIKVAGNFNDWTAAAMTTTDNLTYTYAVGQLAEGFEMQFGVFPIDWHRALKLGGDNNKAKVGDADLEVVLTAGEGAAAFLNAATGTEAENDYANFVAGTIVDSEGTHQYVEDGLANLATAKNNDPIEFYGKILGQYGNQNEYYVAFGQHAIDVYKTALPEGIAVGDIVKVSGKISIYKGLVEVAEGATYTAAPNVVVPATTPLALDGTNFSFDALSLPCVVEGTVKEGTAIDGTANKTVKIVVGDKEIAVFVKKSINLDYAALNTALGTTGATVKLAGFVAIYDSASTVDYATSTGYQVVAPSVVPAA